MLSLRSDLKKKESAIGDRTKTSEKQAFLCQGRGERSRQASDKRQGGLSPKEADASCNICEEEPWSERSARRNHAVRTRRDGPSGS